MFFTFYEAELVIITCRYTTDYFGSNYRCQLLNQVIESESDLDTIDVDHEMNFGDGHVLWISNENSRILFFPSLLVERFPNLTRLSLQNATMTSLLTPISCEKLTYLDLDDNLLSEIPDGLFLNCLQLTTLTLNHNSLEIITEHAFSGLSELLSLSLMYNKLNSIHANAFSSMVKLRNVNLIANNIETLDSNLFQNLSQLRMLTIENNRISILSDDFLSNNRNLEWVNLSNNRLTSIAATLFVSMGSYLVVDLSNNLIEELPIFLSNSGMTELDLGNNKIRKILPGTFEGLSELSALTLSYNRIEDLEPGTFRGLRNLKLLYLISNNITDIQPDAFLGLSIVNALHLSDNQLRHLNASSFASISVGFLGVERNQIESIDSELFNVIHGLNTLDLTGNVCANESFWINWDLPEQGILPIIKACSSSTVHGINVHLLVLVLILFLRSAGSFFFSY